MLFRGLVASTPAQPRRAVRAADAEVSFGKIPKHGIGAGESGVEGAVCALDGNVTDRHRGVYYVSGSRTYAIACRSRRNAGVAAELWNVTRERDARRMAAEQCGSGVALGGCGHEHRFGFFATLYSREQARLAKGRTIMRLRDNTRSVSHYARPSQGMLDKGGVRTITSSAHASAGNVRMGNDASAGEHDRRCDNGRPLRSGQQRELGEFA